VPQSNVQTTRDLQTPKTLGFLLLVVSVDFRSDVGTSNVSVRSRVPVNQAFRISMSFMHDDERPNIVVQAIRVKQRKLLWLGSSQRLNLKENCILQAQDTASYAG
jgi:hypothetical protein